MVFVLFNFVVEGLFCKLWEDFREYGVFGFNVYEGGDGYERV